MTPTALPRADRFGALEAVRAVAALAVVVTHVAFQTGATREGPFAGILARLDLGVALFFALSGFLLFLPHVRRWLAGEPAPSARAYLWRRAVRILPAYWLTVVVCFLVLPGNADVSVADVARHALLVQGYQAGTLREGLTQTWSLATEAAFYVVLPLLAPLVLGPRRGTPVLRRPVLVLAALGLLTVAWLLGSRVVDPEGTLPSGAWLPGTIGWFAAGMLVALLRAACERDAGAVRWVRDIASAPFTCWLLALFVLLVATTPVAGPRLLLPTTGWEMVWKFALYGTVALLVLVPLTMVDTTTSPVPRALSRRPLPWLGELSYSVFLWHLLVLALVYRFTGTELFAGGFWRVLGLTLAGTLVVAALSYRLLERPALRLRSLVPDRPTTAATRQDNANTQAAVPPLEPAP